MTDEQTNSNAASQEDGRNAAAPEVTRSGILDMQVCVPASFTDEQVEAFANTENPSGTENGWRIRRQGDAYQGEAPTRVQCASRGGCVHVMLQC